MEKTEILEKLNDIFKTILNDMDLEISENTFFDDLDNWDSVIQMMIVASIEKEFDVKFKLMEIGTINSVKGYIDAIKTKI